MGRLIFSLFFIIILASACRQREADTARELIIEIGEKYAPDPRTSIFDIKIKTQRPILLYGETNLPEARNALLKQLDSVGIRVTDDIVILPDSSVNDKPYALINVSVANLRSNPRHSAELVTQALLGTPVKLLKTSGGWALVQTPDQYIAWTEQSSFFAMNKSEIEVWKKREKIIYLPSFGVSLNAIGTQVSDLVSGNILLVEKKLKEAWYVQYPDGRRAFVGLNEALPVQNWISKLHISDSSVTMQAKKLLGVPYLWGGTSTKGMDCSGFTKTVYLMHGLILPRDASQQVQVGMLVDTIRNFSHHQVGDLLFFGRKNEDDSERVTHVGLWLGNNEFIHASGDVHISSVDSLSEIFDQFNYNRYLRTKRIFHAETSLPADIREIYLSTEPYE